MELHVPLEEKKPANLAEAIRTITDGLDAVVVGQEWSTVYEDSIHLTLGGNPRDLAMAAERAAHIGGVVD